MTQESMQALVRVRHLAVDEARRDLAICVAAEAAAQETARGIEMAIARETATACSLEGSDQAVQDFAAWLQRIRPSARAADAAVEQALLRTAEARAVLASARAAAEAAEMMVARQEAEHAAGQMRAEQRALDETTAAATVRQGQVRTAIRGRDGSPGTEGWQHEHQPRPE